MAKQQFLIVIVVIDTNVLLISISRKSIYNWLFQLIINNKITVAFTQDIFTEYEEQIRFRWRPSIAENFIQLFEELPNAKLTTVYYNLNLIESDVDDNKFVDCAFAANADYIITNDNHFNILKRIDFPAIPTLSIDQFHKLVIDKNLL